jgi:hypothetical protein
MEWSPEMIREDSEVWLDLKGVQTVTGMQQASVPGGLISEAAYKTGSLMVSCSPSPIWTPLISPPFC